MIDFGKLSKAIIELTEQFAAGEEAYLKWVAGNIKELNLAAMPARNHHLINMENQKAKSEIVNLKLSAS